MLRQCCPLHVQATSIEDYCIKLQEIVVYISIWAGESIDGTYSLSKARPGRLVMKQSRWQWHACTGPSLWRTMKQRNALLGKKMNAEQ